MSGSFKRIDYRLRISKQIERRMIVEALALLQRSGNVRNYRYVGMGAIAFADFVMIHRALDINDMISIEVPTNQLRVDFNKPLNCIEIDPFECSEVLARLSWEKQNIVWLDFDEGINNAVIEDIGHCAANLVAGSVLIVTLNAAAGGDPNYAMEQFPKLVSAERHPDDLSQKDFSGGKYPELLRQLLQDEIDAKLSDRNSGVGPDNAVRFKQFLNFSYADGAEMCTYGWVVEEGKADLIELCGLNDLSFYRSGASSMRINPPALTPKEIRHLNQQLPLKRGAKLASPGISDEKLKAYQSLYRHFPLYYEVID